MNTEVNPTAVDKVANYLRSRSGGTATVAFSLQAEEIVAIVAELLTPEDIGMENVIEGENLSWPWYRYPEVPREQFRGHGPDRYKETYPL
jgi:hypothetical protein